MRLPVDGEPCRPNDDLTIHPYGPELDGILSDVMPRNRQRLESVVRLNDDAILVAGPGLFVVRRGQRAERGRDAHDGPDVWIPPERLWPTDTDGRVTAVQLMAPNAQGIRRGLATVQGIRDIGWIHELEVSAAGVELVRTATETVGRLSDIDLTQSGQFVAVAERPRLLIGQLDQPTLRSVPINENIEDGIVVRWTGQPDTPIIVGGDRAVYVSNADLTEWQSEGSSIVGERSEVSELAQIRRRPESMVIGDEIWAAGQRATLLVRAGTQDWERVFLTFPPRFESCAIPGEPRDSLRSLRHIDALAGGTEYVYFSQENCDAVVAVRVRDRCVSVLTPDGGPTRVRYQVDGDDKQLRGATFDGGELIMVGDEGRVVTTKFTQP